MGPLLSCDPNPNLNLVLRSRSELDPAPRFDFLNDLFSSEPVGSSRLGSGGPEPFTFFVVINCDHL